MMVGTHDGPLEVFLKVASGEHGNKQQEIEAEPRMSSENAAVDTFTDMCLSSARIYTRIYLKMSKDPFCWFACMFQGGGSVLRIRFT